MNVQQFFRRKHLNRQTIRVESYFGKSGCCLSEQCGLNPVNRSQLGSGPADQVQPTLAGIVKLQVVIVATNVQVDLELIEQSRQVLEVPLTATMLSAGVQRMVPNHDLVLRLSLIHI